MNLKRALHQICVVLIGFVGVPLLIICAEGFGDPGFTRFFAGFIVAFVMLGWLIYVGMAATGSGFVGRD